MTPRTTPMPMPAPTPGDRGRYGGLAADFAAAFSAEWLKLRTLRSTWWILLTFFAVGASFAVLYGAAAGGRVEEHLGDPAFDPVFLGFGGQLIAQLAMVCLGVLAVGGEYSSGTIRSSLTAVPRRGLFWAAKSAVLGAVALAAALPTAFIGFWLAQTSMGPELNVSLGDPGALRATLGVAVHLTVICLISAGVTAVLRGTVLSLGVLVPLIFLLPQLIGPVPGVVGRVAWYLPQLAGSQLMRSFPDERVDFGPGGALAVMLVWAAVAFAGGLAALRRRDA
ncbi:ABC transporter permease subunit [Streptomyces amakusaensis]